MYYMGESATSANLVKASCPIPLFLSHKAWQKEGDLRKDDQNDIAYNQGPK